MVVGFSTAVDGFANDLMDEEFEVIEPMLLRQ